MKNLHKGNRIRQNQIPIARAGYPFILISALATVLLALFGFEVPAMLFLTATLFIIFFFRDPERRIPGEANAIVSPADGRVVSVETVSRAPLLTGPCKKISVFMSVFNVHVNRIPHEGRIQAIRYNKGSFMAADRDRASDENERNAILVETEDGNKISVVQVAGLIARRIVCVIRENERVARGQRLGLIRFGSRVDLYLPEKTTLQVRAGDRVRAGTSVVGYLQ